MLVNLSGVLEKASKEQYAVGLFNTVHLEAAQGVLRAAKTLRAPVIIGTAEVLLPYASLRELSSLLLPMIEQTPVPIVLHYDHGLTEEKIHEAIDCGFSSVMYDCSACSYEENIERVRRLVEYAHANNVTVEAELGHVGNADHPDEGSDVYTDPEQAAEFVRLTNVDALAVAIGTAHGPYLKKPVLDLKRLAQIRKAVSVPLVLHGGSGLSDDDFRNCIAGGVSKVNIFTDINRAAARAAAEHYAAGIGMTELMPHMVDAVCAETAKKIRLFSCDGKA